MAIVITPPDPDIRYVPSDAVASNSVWWGICLTGRTRLFFVQNEGPGEDRRCKAKTPDNVHGTLHKRIAKFAAAEKRDGLRGYCQEFLIAICQKQPIRKRHGGDHIGPTIA